jgi:hypothetical protein
MRRMWPASQMKARRGTGNATDRSKPNGSGAAGAPTLGAFAKSRRPWTPPKQALAPEASAALRDRLLAGH